MKKMTYILAAATLIAAPLPAQTFRLYDVVDSPFATFIAKRPGDLVTIVVEESATTEDKADRLQTRDNDADFNLSQFFVPPFNFQEGFSRTELSGDPPGVSFDTTSTFEADAENTSEHAFRTTLQARLVEAIGNGQFVIRGHRIVNLNGKDKKIFISGVIRQRDITRDNTIRSNQIADAMVEIEGEMATKDTRPGIFMKLFNMIF